MQIYQYQNGNYRGFTTNEIDGSFNRNTPVSPLVVLQEIIATPFQNKIALIKIMRGISSLGLKEAKDEIETVLPYGKHDNFPPDTLIKLIKLFIKYFPELEEATHFFAAGLKAKKEADIKQAAADRKEALEQAKRKAQEIKDAAELQRREIMEGIACAYNNYRILGYRDPFFAMQETIQRIECKIKGNDLT